MIDIYFNGRLKFSTYSVDKAIKYIRRLKKRGIVEWTCADSEDNQFIWENT